MFYIQAAHSKNFITPLRLLNNRKYMKKKITFSVVVLAFMLIGVLTVCNYVNSSENGVDGESYLQYISKLGSVLAGKAFYMPPVDSPKKNSSYASLSKNKPAPKIIVVSGVGETMKEAKKDALNKAYKRSGVHFKSDVSYDNGDNVDEMNEIYTEITDVIVENSEVVSAKLIDGVVNVKLRVTITNVPKANKRKIQ